MDGTVLVADDDRTIRTVLTQALTRSGCKVHATSSLTTLMRWVEEGRGDLVISDVIMPDGNGLETLPKIGNVRPDLPVIIVSAQNTIMTAIQAAEANAYDYLPKPFDLPDLMKRCARALEQRSLNARKPAPPAGQDSDLPLVGRTPVMQEIYRVLARVLNTDLPIFFTGESGTGKSLIARALHENSDRRNSPLVIVGSDELSNPGNVAASISKAKSGSILFDEIGDLSLAVQTHLVRAIDMMGPDAPRLMAATQKDIETMVAAGEFRQDLYFRLSAVLIAVPALRNRLDDIPLLADFFLQREAKSDQIVKHFSEKASAALRGAPWSGNVRQLENAVRRLVATCPETEITLSDVQEILSANSGFETRGQLRTADKLSASIKNHLEYYFELHGKDLPPAGLYARILKEMEVPLIELALEASNGNQAKCAELLGINRNTLRKKITELDIRVTRRRKLM